MIMNIKLKNFLISIYLFCLSVFGFCRYCRCCSCFFTVCFVRFFVYSSFFIRHEIDVFLTFFRFEKLHVSKIFWWLFRFPVIASHCVLSFQFKCVNITTIMYISCGIFAISPNFNRILFWKFYICFSFSPHRIVFV